MLMSCLIMSSLRRPSQSSTIGEVLSIGFIDKWSIIMSNDMPKPRHLMLFDAFYDGSFHVELFSYSIISDSVPPGNFHDTSEFSPIFLCLVPGFTSINYNRQYEVLIQSLHILRLHILLKQIFCFNLPKACTAYEIWYAISVWMFGTILPMYLNVYTCSIGRSSTSMLLLDLSPYGNEHTSYDPVLECSFLSSSICMQPCSSLHLDAASQ